jgi:hypothetical protein
LSSVPIAQALQRLDDEFRGSDEIGALHDLVAALGMDQHLYAGYALTHVGDALGREATVYRAVSTPQDHASVAQLLCREGWSVRVPHHAVVEGHAEIAHGGVAAQVLVGQEDHALTALEGPLQ